MQLNPLSPLIPDICLMFSLQPFEEVAYHSPVAMSKETQSQLDARQVQPALNLFLKKIPADFSVESCADALIGTLAHYLPSNQLFGLLWEPHRRTNDRSRLTSYNGTVVKTRETAPEALAYEEEKTYRHDLRIMVHTSLKTFASDPSIRKEIEQQGNRSAIEIHFCYYGRPLLWIIFGFPNARQLPGDSVQEFLLLLCRCCLVSLHGAYLAEIEEREGRRHTPQITERYSRTVQWLHSTVRHLNAGIEALLLQEIETAEDSLERASIVAGVCLAELISLMQDVEKRINDNDNETKEFRSQEPESRS
jgi:hypothetical protein